MNNAKTQRMKENKRKEETGRLIAFHLSADDFDRKEKMNCNKDDWDNMRTHHEIHILTNTLK